MRLTFMLLIAVCLLVCAPPLTSAQDIDDLPDASVYNHIFSSSVDVTMTIPPTVDKGDNTGLFVYDGRGWQLKVFPKIPESMDNCTDVIFEPFAEGQLMARALPDCAGMEGNYVGDEDWPQDLNSGWLYSPATDQFRRAEPVCDHNLPMPNKPWLWTLYPGRGGRVESWRRLCNVATGEKTAYFPLVYDINLYAFEVGHSSPFSHDGHWMIEVRDVVDGPLMGLEREVFVHNLMTYQEIRLGYILEMDMDCSNGYGPYNEMGLEPYFVGDHLTLVATDTGCGGRRIIYSADLNSANSLRQIVMARRFDIGQIVQENEAYLWTNNEIFAHDDPLTASNRSYRCAIHEYQTATGKVRSYTIAHVCGAGISVPDGSGDRLYLADNGTDHAALIRFNLNQGTSETVKAGDFWFLWSVSPDGRFAVLLIDGSYTGYPLYGARRLMILDLQKRGPVFQTEAQPDRSQFQFYWSPQGTHALIMGLPQKGGNSTFISWDARDKTSTVISRAPTKVAFLNAEWRDENTILFTHASPIIQWLVKVP